MNRPFNIFILSCFISACGGGIELTHTQNNAPKPLNDVIETQEDVSVALDKIIDNDIDLDSDEISIVDISEPMHGIILYETDRKPVYIPNPDFNGEDRFEYSITDGWSETESATIVIKVNAANDAPVATDREIAITSNEIGAEIDLRNFDVVSDIDSTELDFELVESPLHGEFTLSEKGIFTFSPKPGYEGLDTFRFGVNDGEYKAEATITLNIGYVNDTPTATDDKFIVSRLTSTRTPNVLENDDDLDGDELFIVSWTQPESGSIYYQGAGNLNIYHTPTLSQGHTLSPIQSVTVVKIEVLPK